MTASRPRPTRTVAFAGLLAASFALPAAAQDDPQAAVPLAPSMECRVPGSQLYTTAMLAASKAALEERHTLKILAIGGSSAPGASASYPVKLEAALEQAMPKVDVVIEHRGLPGEIAAGAAERLRSLVADADPTSWSGRSAPTMRSPGSTPMPSPRPWTIRSRG